MRRPTEILDEIVTREAIEHVVSELQKARNDLITRSSQHGSDPDLFAARDTLKTLRERIVELRNLLNNPERLGGDLTVIPEWARRAVETRSAEIIRSIIPRSDDALSEPGI